MEDEVIKINYDASDAQDNVSPASTPAITENNENDDQEDTENSRKESRWGKIKEIKEQRNYLAEENEALKQELAARERLLQHSYNTSVYHYGQNVNSVFENAKQNYIAAVQSGDPEALANATVEMAAATSDLTKVNDKIAQLQNQNNNQVEYYDAEGDQIIFDPVEEWLEENEEINPDSPNYDPRLVEKLIPTIKAIDSKLKQGKQDNLIGTPQYFDLLDKYIDKLKSSKSNDNGYVGPVSSRHVGGVSSRGDRIQLTRDQKEAAAAFDMTEKEYAGYLKKYAEEARNGR